MSAANNLVKLNKGSFKGTYNHLNTVCQIKLDCMLNLNLGLTGSTGLNESLVSIQCLMLLEKV
jgi:hypothetical protein